MKNHGALKGTSVRADQPVGQPMPEYHEALLTTKEAAHLLHLSHRTLEAMRLRGGGPPFIALTRKAVRYHRGDLKNWISARRRNSTSDTLPSHVLEKD